jgi:hypothetical protein
MAINSKSELCNLSLSRLGNYNSISDIDTPVTQHEQVFALWYDVARQAFLKMTMPNFSLARKSVALLDVEPAFGYAYAYEYPVDCLRVLGVGDTDNKINNYSVEGNAIQTDILYEDGLPLRYVADIEDVTKMSPEFKLAFSWYLASCVALEITQDMGKVSLIEQILPSKIMALSGMNAQENMPIRISRSLFKQSRYADYPTNVDKK